MERNKILFLLITIIIGVISFYMYGGILIIPVIIVLLWLVFRPTKSKHKLKG